ncbi:uncharacterized protein LOC144325667 [Podarcis muralis]
MHSSCLILLCFGVYASCRPTGKLLAALIETQKYLHHAMDQVKNKDLATPLVDIPEKQNPKQCEKKDLKTFNNSLDSVPQFHEYHNLRSSLHELAKRWHSQNESDLNCKTSKGSPKQLLENLKIFLKRLHDGKWLKTEAKQ